MTNGPAPKKDSQIQLFHLPEAPEPYRKAVEVLHSKPLSAMSLVHRKVSNAWLKNAMGTQPDSEGWFSISLVRMMDDIGFESNNRAYLVKASRELMTVIFEWDVMSNKVNKPLWKASVLFPEVEITQSEVRYQISKQLLNTVLNPEVYAVIDQSVIRKFRRAPAVALYEFCIRYERLGRTAFVEWETLRDMIMGVSADAPSYREFKIFKDKILKPSIAEIEAAVSWRLELLHDRVGRKVKAVAFQISKIETSSETDMPGESLGDIGELVAIGLSQNEARQIVSSHPHDDIMAAIDYIKNRVNDKYKKPIANSPAYIRTVLAKGWAVKKSTPTKTTTSTSNGKSDKSNISDLEEQFLMERDKEAEAYYKEMDADDQNKAVHSYNEKQQTDGLKLKIGKKNPKGAVVAFARWLSLETWGKPTNEDLLNFASRKLSR